MNSTNSLEDKDVPAEILEAFEILLNELLPIALDQLEDHGEFYPFAGTLSTDGTFEEVLGTAEEAHPDPAVFLEGLLDVLRGDVIQNKDIVAAGIVTDVEVTPPEGDQKVDAVCLELEHRLGEFHASFVQYTKDAKGRVEDKEMWICEGVRNVFPQIRQP